VPLLGIGKKQEPEKQEEVPEELPDLPQAAENAPDAGPDAQVQAAPDELPPVDAPSSGELAPDELPPVTDELSDQGVELPTDDKRLYFSTMLQKLHEDGLKSTKLTTPSVNLLSDMKKHWRDKRKSDQVDAMRQQIAESLTPLQKLEQEWVALQEDIDQKKKMLHEKEEAIKKLAEEARSLAVKADKIGFKEK
jgi:hypothetical protein